MASGRTKSGKREMNPTDAYRKQLRKREIKKNRKERKKVREISALLRDPDRIMSEIKKMETMDQQGLLDSRLRHKLLQLRQTHSAVVRKQKVQVEMRAAEEATLRKHLSSEHEDGFPQTAQDAAQVEAELQALLQETHPVPPAPFPQLSEKAPGMQQPASLQAGEDGYVIGGVPPPPPPKPGAPPPPPPPRTLGGDGGLILGPPPPPPRPGQPPPGTGKKTAIDPLDPSVPTYTERTVAYTTVQFPGSVPLPSNNLAYHQQRSAAPPMPNPQPIAKQDMSLGPTYGPVKPKTIDKDMLKFMPTNMRVKRKFGPAVTPSVDGGTHASSIPQENLKVKPSYSLPAVPMPAGARLLVPLIAPVNPASQRVSQSTHAKPALHRPPAKRPPSQNISAQKSAGAGGVEDEYASFMEELSKLG